MIVSSIGLLVALFWHLTYATQPPGALTYDTQPPGALGYGPSTPRLIHGAGGRNGTGSVFMPEGRAIDLGRHGPPKGVDGTKGQILAEKYKNLLLALDPRQDNDFTKERQSSVSESSPSSWTYPSASGRRWGSHPLPPLDYFEKTGGGVHGLRQGGGAGVAWSAYFHDQAIAIILGTDGGVVANCTLLEVIEVWEQRAALEYLGHVMPLVPVPFDHMVHLVTLCGTLAPLPPPPPTMHGKDSGLARLWWLHPSTLHGLLPGTLWCGMGDQAPTYHHLGEKTRLDVCCRAHDHCPVKLKAMKTRYGITNFDFKTKSHCACDLEFFRCLKAAQDPIADVVGQVYFNYIRMQCLETDLTTSDRTSPVTPPRMTCTKVDSEGHCRMWLPGPKGSFTHRLAITRPKLVF